MGTGIGEGIVAALTDFSKSDLISFPKQTNKKRFLVLTEFIAYKPKAAHAAPQHQQFHHHLQQPLQTPQQATAAWKREAEKK